MRHFFAAPKEIPADIAYDVKTIKEEVASMASHGVAFLIFAMALPFLWVWGYQSGNTWYFVGTIVYGISLLMVYASSTLYHNSYQLKARQRFQIFDHICIYFLIAGSYTPFIVTHLKTTAGWLVLGTLWSMVIVGTFFKLYYTNRFQLFSTLLYLVLGWLVVFIIQPLMDAVSPLCFWWIVVGGLFYTVGVIFYLWEKLPYNHVIWHVFVFGGSLAHFIAVWYCL